MKGKSPSDPDGGPRVLTVSVTLAPTSRGILLACDKENVASDGRPVTLRVSAGVVPVEPETRVSVTVYVVLFDLSRVWLGVMVVPKLYELTATLPEPFARSTSPV